MTDSASPPLLHWEFNTLGDCHAGDYWIARSDITNADRRYAVLFKGTEIARPRKRTGSRRLRSPSGTRRGK